MGPADSDNDGANANDNERAIALAPCPICNKPASVKYRPFCSRRCADVDLARWLGGRYAIPARADEDENEDGAKDSDEY